MKRRNITVTEAARNSAGRLNRKERVCTGRRAEALADVKLSEKEARLWYRDLQAARKRLRSPGK